MRRLSRQAQGRRGGVVSRGPGNTGFAHGWAAPQKSRYPRLGGDPRAVVLAGRRTRFQRCPLVPARGRDSRRLGGERTDALNLCPCDKHDTTYFNNIKVGEMGRENPTAWATPRSYTISASVAKAGRNFSSPCASTPLPHGGGMMGSTGEPQSLGPDDAPPAAPRLPLAGSWQYKVRHNFGKANLATGTSAASRARQFQYPVHPVRQHDPAVDSLCDSRGNLVSGRIRCQSRGAVPHPFSRP